MAELSSLDLLSIEDRLETNTTPNAALTNPWKGASHKLELFRNSNRSVNTLIPSIWGRGVRNIVNPKVKRYPTDNKKQNLDVNRLIFSDGRVCPKDNVLPIINDNVGSMFGRNHDHTSSIEFSP